MSAQTSMHTYDLADGRTALSPVSLTHAVNDNNHLDLSLLTEAEQAQLSIVANPFLGLLLPIAFDGEEWVPAEKLLSMTNSELLETSYYRNYCVVKNGEIYIRDGAFIPLNAYLENASPEKLKAALYHATMQTALAQMYVAAETTKKKDKSTRPRRKAGGR